MDEVYVRAIMNEGPPTEERLPPRKAASKHQAQGFSLNPTFGSSKGYFDNLNKVQNIINRYFVYCLFAVVQCSIGSVTQALFKGSQKT